MVIVIKTISFLFARGYSEPNLAYNKEDVLYLKCTQNNQLIVVLRK